MLRTDSVVAIYRTHEQAEEAVRQLHQAGVEIGSLSLAAREHRPGDYLFHGANQAGRQRRKGQLGAHWGGLWGLVFDATLFVVPGIGGVILGGPLASSVLAVRNDWSRLGGVSALCAALVSAGMPEDSAIAYEAALRADNFLLVTHGTLDAVVRANSVIAKTDFDVRYLHDEVVMAA